MAKVPTSETGHGQGRDQGGPPALQEDEHHDDDQHQRLEQGVDDLLDALTHRLGRVQGE